MNCKRRLIKAIVEYEALGDSSGEPHTELMRLVILPYNSSDGVSMLNPSEIMTHDGKAIELIFVAKKNCQPTANP